MARPPILGRPVLLACACPPIRHRPLVEPEGSDERWQQAALREPHHYDHHQLSRGTPRVEDGAFRRGEGFVALLTDKPLLLARGLTEPPRAHDMSRNRDISRDSHA